MTQILSLIANPASPVIDDALLARMRAALPVRDVTELSPGVAYDLALGDAAPHGMDAARIAAAGAPVDINILSPAGRKKRLLIADMDSTIINQECIDELAEYAGKRAEIEAITERAMRGELDFESALKERVSMLAGLSEQTLAETFEKRITIASGAATLIATMKANGAMTALVSGGFTYFAGRVAQTVGFDRHRANQLIIKDAKLTGTVEEPILGRDAKLAALEEFSRAHGVTPGETLAVGDGANDLAMLGAAGLGVAFHAKPAVAAAAHAHVDHGDLTALLFLQGIPESAFAR